jgi:Fur family transcriptional regulator, ferric uptake regulator
MDSQHDARLSKNHRLVYEVVREQGVGRHLSMAELYEIASARRPGIGFTTVYRALTRLRDQGLVAELTLPGADSAYYEPATEPHAHFRCSGCGRVEDVPFALSGDVLATLASQLHAQVAGASVSLHGRCAACSAYPA